AKLVELGVPVCLIGPPGTGKTTMLESLAKSRGQRLLTAVGYDMSTSDLVGTWRLRGGATVFRRGVLLRAVVGGHMLYLDEIYGLSEDCFRLLLQLLDGRRQLTVPALSKTFDAHPDFRFVASYNPSADGVERLPRELRDRMAMLEVQRLDEPRETELLTQRFDLESRDVAYLLRFAKVTRRVDASGGASTRQLDTAARMVLAGFDVRTACHDCILRPMAGTNRMQFEAALNALRADGLDNFEELASYREEAEREANQTQFSEG
ncbi:MAG: AAA family ATPase, partial [Planctomycetales bacterium]|nr:AAA family ATPase [Planctomycetales bacterium]